MALCAIITEIKRDTGCKILLFCTLPALDGPVRRPNIAITLGMENYNGGSTSKYQSGWN